MAPARGTKPEINPWGWVTSVEPENVGLEHMLRAYRILDYRYCEDPRRSCKRNPFCYYGLGEKKWIHGGEEGSEDEDNGFREEGEFAGLQNLGATCYVNSLLQLWYHNPILRPAIFRWQPSLENQSNEPYRPDGPIGQLQAMFARMKMSKKSKIDPREFVNALQLDTGEQQDAQEFSKLFLEVILRQMLTAEYGDAGVRETVASTFRGELQNENECTKCNNKTLRQESFNELELGVMKNLNESLDELLQDERLTDSNQYYCSVCQSKNDAIRRTQLLKLPPVLNLQLMRFVFDRETYRKKKVNTTIQFPEVLDMSSRVHQIPGTTQEALVYHLSAVLVHNGPSASSGHYVAQIKDLTTGIWHKFNDENVDRDRVANNAKSQKLILKEDEGSGSDNEKAKQRKAKAAAVAPGFHSSQGAYMLVYTLERYIKEPEADPEPWMYLQKMIKREDDEYEEEVRKSKSDKDFENDCREQRKREIATLYPSLELAKKAEKNADPDERNYDSDDFQPPKKRVARSDMNGVSKVVDISDRNGNCSKKEGSTNGHGVEHNSKPVLKKLDQKAEHGMAELKHTLSNLQHFDESSETAVSNIHFISSDWLQQWLDAGNPPPPMELKNISCEHGLLAPPLPGVVSCSYKAIPRSFASVLYDNYSVDGPRFEGVDALCRTCVQRECQRLRKLDELDKDHKVFVDVNKKFDSICSFKEKSGELGDPSTWGPTCLWLSKEVLRNWKRAAKLNIEQEFKSSVGSNSAGDADTHEEDSEVSSLPFNSELICPHDNLIPNAKLRTVIPDTSWEILRRYFPNAVAIWVIEKEDCVECMNAKKGDNEIRNMNKEHAQKQKSRLLDLYLERNRPSTTESGFMFILSYDFFSRWKRFIKDPTKYDPVVDVNNKSLLCSTHEEFMYPLKYHNKVIAMKPEEEKFCLVYPSEWNAICEMFSVDTTITIQVAITDQLKYLYKPGVCQLCAADWWTEVQYQKFNYNNQSIHIVRREKLSTEEQQSDDDDFVNPPPVIPTTSKRARKPHDPSGWTTPIWTRPPELIKDSAIPKTGLRTSARRRKPRGEKSKTYKISSLTTLKELKFMITSGFGAGVSDQHLFFDGEELTNDQLSSTLGELKIPAESTLYLEIDTVPKQDDDDPVDRPVVVENGFSGTLLLNTKLPITNTNL